MVGLPCSLRVAFVVRRHHRHLLLCRRLRLPLRLLPRLALVEGGHRQLPTDQKGLSRGILDAFCSCPMVRLVPLCKRGDNGRRTQRQEFARRLIDGSRPPTMTSPPSRLRQYSFAESLEQIFLVWLFSQEDIGGQPIRRAPVGAFWIHSAHAQMLRLVTHVQTRLQWAAHPETGVCPATDRRLSSADDDESAFEAAAIFIR